MTDIFRCKDEMPARKENEVRSSAMVRDETPYDTPLLSGEQKWPNDVQSVMRPRRGHAY